VIELGYTESVRISENSLLNYRSGTDFVDISANARTTRIGRNFITDDSKWESDYVTDSGVGTMFNHTIQPLVDSTAVLSLTNQNNDTSWQTVSNVSSIVASSPEAKGWLFQISIKSNTVNARFYIVGRSDAPTWSNRATDTRVQFVECQSGNGTNTSMALVRCSSAYPDEFYYGISDESGSDTDVQIRLLGVVDMD